MTRAQLDTAIEEAPTRDLWFTSALGVLALLPRLFVAIAWSREPVWDGHYYHFGAERIAAGLGYSEDVMVAGHLVWKPWCHYPVGYSAFLGLIYKIFGTNIQVAPLCNAVIGALLAVLVHRIGRHYLTENRARVAGALSALHPGLIAYTAVVMTEQLAILLVLGALWATLHFRGRWSGVILSGVLIGLSTLVRPACLLAAPLLFLAHAEAWRPALVRTAVATAFCMLTVLPWTLRNCTVMDGCALVSTNGGWNLAIGALSETGRFVTLRAADGCPVVTGQVQQDRCWARVGQERIRRDPLRWLSLIPLKLGQTYNHESFAIEYLREASPGLWPEPRRVAGRELLTFFHRLLLSLAGLGVVARVGLKGPKLDLLCQLAMFGVVMALSAYGFQSDWHPFHWLAIAIPLLGFLPIPGRPWQGEVGYYALAWFCATSCTHAAFFGDDRYHLVVTPVLCLLAAAALRPSSRLIKLR